MARYRSDVGPLLTGFYWYTSQPRWLTYDRQQLINAFMSIRSPVQRRCSRDRPNHPLGVAPLSYPPGHPPLFLSSPLLSGLSRLASPPSAPIRTANRDTSARGVPPRLSTILQPSFQVRANLPPPSHPLVGPQRSSRYARHRYAAGTTRRLSTRKKGNARKRGCLDNLLSLRINIRFAVHYVI